MTDPLRPATWTAYDKTFCTQCWAGCCTLPVPLSAEDLFHMGFIRFDEVEAPLKPIAERLLKKGIIQSFQTRGKVFTLAQRENGDCVFLDENRFCKIYDNRPSVCRRFPENSKRPGYCPSRPKSIPS